MCLPCKGPLFLGLLFGIAFGYFLQRGKISKFDTIINQLLLKDFTVLKVMFTAIIVGGLGICFLYQNQMISLGISPSSWSRLLLGGTIFGIGMGTLGFCPATGVAAVGEGSKDAAWGVLGFIAGTALFAELYPMLTNIITKWPIEPITILDLFR